MDIAALGNRLGLSEMQTRRIVSALGDNLTPFISRGDKGKILVSEQALPMLERARDLKSDGVPYDDLGQRIADEIGGDRNESAEALSDKRRNPDEIECPVCRERATMIRMLEDRISELKEDRDYYRQLALPAPDRRPWWQRLLGIAGQ